MTAGLLLRDREVLERVTTPESEGNCCTYCEKPLVQAWFHRLDESGEPCRDDPMYGGAVQSYPSWRHADGSDGHGERLGPNDYGVILPKHRCPECKAFDTIQARDTGYGSDCTCTACGWHKYFDRGD